MPETYVHTSPVRNPGHENMAYLKRPRPESVLPAQDGRRRTDGDARGPHAPRRGRATRADATAGWQHAGWRGDVAREGRGGEARLPAVPSMSQNLPKLRTTLHITCQKWRTSARWMDGSIGQSARRPSPRRRGGKRPHWRQRLADIATGLACPFHSGAARVLRGGEGDRGGLGSGGGVRLARCATSPRMPRSFCSSPQPTMHALRRIFTTRSGWSLSSGGTLPQERRRLLHPLRYAYGSRRRSAAAAEAAQELEEDSWADEARGMRA